MRGHYNRILPFSQKYLIRKYRGTGQYYLPRSNSGKAVFTDSLPYPRVLSFNDENFPIFNRKRKIWVVLFVKYEKTLVVGHLILSTHCTSEQTDSEKTDYLPEFYS